MADDSNDDDPEALIKQLSMTMQPPFVNLIDNGNGDVVGER